MNQYRLITEKYKNTIEKIVQQSPSQLRNKWKIEQTDTVTYFTYPYNKREQEQVAEAIAGLLSEWIQQEITKDFAEKYLSKREDLSYKEKQHIQVAFMTSNCFLKEEGISYIAYYLIYAPLIEMLKKNCFIHIDGWLTFRGNQYKRVLEELIEQSIMDYLLQEDYEEILFLLKENKKLQISLEDSIHLMPNERGEIRLYNSQLEDYTEDYITQYCCELLEDTQVKVEDLLMQVLITVSPKKLVIHQKDNYCSKPFIFTLEYIFQEEIMYCSECEYCRLNKNQLNS